MLKGKLNGCRGRVGLLLLSGVFAGVVEVFVLARFMCIFGEIRDRGWAKLARCPARAVARVIHLWSGWGKGKDFSLTISITESHLPTSIIHSHLHVLDSVAVGQKHGLGQVRACSCPSTPPRPKSHIWGWDQSSPYGTRIPKPTPSAMSGAGQTFMTQQWQSPTKSCWPKTQQRDSKLSIPEGRGAGSDSWWPAVRPSNDTRIGGELWLDPESWLLAGRGMFMSLYALEYHLQKLHQSISSRHWTQMGVQ